jgi:hypothetical protein
LNSNFNVFLNFKINLFKIEEKNLFKIFKGFYSNLIFHNEFYSKLFSNNFFYSKISHSFHIQQEKLKLESQKPESKHRCMHTCECVFYAHISLERVRAKKKGKSRSATHVAARWC